MMKLTVTLPDGVLATRSTEHAYEFVLAAFGKVWDKKTSAWAPTPIWHEVSWHHSLPAAEKARAHKLSVAARRGYDTKTFQIVPVNPTEVKA
jgi:hypothetical protein